MRTLVLPVLEDTRVWEAGHYYESVGPTVWSVLGWKVLSQHAHPNDSRMLFVDDVHGAEQLHELERNAPRVPFEPYPEPTHYLTESEVLADARHVLESLRTLPRRKRARKGKGGRWECAGFPLTNSQGYPLCLLFDLGLVHRKRELGFRYAVNVLPDFYAQQQWRLHKLTKRLYPDFQLEVVLFDADGMCRRLEATD